MGLAHLDQRIDLLQKPAVDGSESQSDHDTLAYLEADDQVQEHVQHARAQIHQEVARLPVALESEAARIGDAGAYFIHDEVARANHDCEGEVVQWAWPFSILKIEVEHRERPPLPT